MPMVTIIAKQFSDKTPAVNITPEEMGGELQIVDAVILERGTSNGLTSISIGMRDINGKYFIAQTTGRIFAGILVAMRAAEARWEKVQANKNNPDIFPGQGYDPR